MAKKKYSIKWEDDDPVSFEVNGVQYESLEDIPDEDDRLKLEAMLSSAEDAQFDSEFAKMEAEAQRPGRVSGERIILWVFSGVAILMLLIALISSASNILKISREERAPGRVVDVRMERSYVNEQDRIVQEFYYPVVQFVANDGRQGSVKMNEGSSSPSYEVGDEVVILYEPEHPLDARIKSFGSAALMWILPGITGILGIVFLGAVLAVPFFMQPDKSTS